MKPRSVGGFQLEAADVTQERERLYRLQFTSLCGKCPDWSYVANSPEEGTRAFAEHQKLHPANVDRGQRTRRRAAGQISKGWKKN